jgi:hypothetical protein
MTSISHQRRSEREPSGPTREQRGTCVRDPVLEESSRPQPPVRAGTGVPAIVMLLHEWLKAHDYNYFSINSVPSLGPLDYLLDRCRSLGIAWRQLFRLCPFDVRLLLGVESVQDPEATILLARAYGKLHRVYGDVFRTPAEECWHRLLRLGQRDDGLFAVPQRRKIRTLNYSTDESEISPLLTAWAGSVFLERYAARQEKESLGRAAQVAAYFLHHHPRDTSDQGVYFYYTPHLAKRVFNASAEMSAFLVEYGVLSGAREAQDLGWQGMRFVLNAQNADGSWFYGEESWGRYIDSFHTAFILLALARVQRLVPAPSLAAALAKGSHYYVSRLCRKGKHGLRPVRYDGRYRPMNSTLLQRADLRDCALAMILFCQLAEHGSPYQEMAMSILKWTMARMRHGCWFYPEILWSGKNHNPYINFQAWMLLALATMCQHHQLPE